MRKTTNLMLFLVVLALASSCSKKNEPTTVIDPNTCELSEILTNLDGQQTTLFCEYDTQRRIKAVKRDGPYGLTFDYSANKIVRSRKYDEERTVIEEVYDLDMQGRVSKMTTSNATSIYSYSPDGYLSEVKRSWQTNAKQEKINLKFSYADGNLTRLDIWQNGVMEQNYQYTYSKDTAPKNSIPFDIDGVNDEIDSFLIDRFGKRSVNLVETSIRKRSLNNTPYYYKTIYTHIKNKQGNIIQFKKVSNTFDNIHKTKSELIYYKYNCK